jgi:hypothetical protein
MTPESDAKAQVDAIIARDRLRLSAEEYERLVAIYAETQTQLDGLRAPEFRDTEPASVFPAASR